MFAFIFIPSHIRRVGNLLELIFENADYQQFRDSLNWLGTNFNWLGTNFNWLGTNFNKIGTNSDNRGVNFDDGPLRDLNYGWKMEKQTTYFTSFHLPCGLLFKN